MTSPKGISCTPAKILRGIKQINEFIASRDSCTPTKIVRDIKQLLF